MRTLYLIRGVSGSGKTTRAVKLCNDTGVDFYEADEFFYKEDGSYAFDASKLSDAHSWCKSMVAKKMFDGEDVAVSNTFTRYWELKSYLELAVKYGYGVMMITCKGEYQNVHGVPDSKVQEMRDRFESDAVILKAACEDFGKHLVQVSI